MEGVGGCDSSSSASRPGETPAPSLRRSWMRQLHLLAPWFRLGHRRLIVQIVGIIGSRQHLMDAVCVGERGVVSVASR
jgi:hypothetical protein